MDLGYVKKGCFVEYDSIFEFIQDLDEEAELAHETRVGGSVIYEKHQQQQQQILTQDLLLKFASEYGYINHYLMQFWGVEKVEGSHHSLSTKHHPFSFGYCNKGLCWYRKLCSNHVYDVDVQGGDDEEDLGAVGRVYRNKNPESTPDLRLYSTNQFPMRDVAARCGFRDYMAVPLFDSHTNHCYGVLEILALNYSLWRFKLPLKFTGLKSTHSFSFIADLPNRMQQPQSEIRDILELVVATVPRLYLVLVWGPCLHCTNSSCMEFASFITSQNQVVNSKEAVDYYMKIYLEACAFHKLDQGSFDSSNLCEVSISKNPLAHYAQKARISHSFAVSLESLNNSNQLYLLQFFLHPKFREDVYGDNLLLRIIEMNRKSFKVELLGQLAKENQKSNAIECEPIDSLEVIKSYKQKMLESDFITYLETVDSCCHRPSSKDGKEGWVFGSLAGERLRVYMPMKKKIETFMKILAFDEEYWIVQFWALKMVENRRYLETSDQPYVVGCLAKGLASYRKKCTTHHYVVGDEAKEEELGPPGRVFRNGHPEITPDLLHYTTKEFPIRNYAMHCRTRPYFALPIFDDQYNQQCAGVLEFVGVSHDKLYNIQCKLEAVELSWCHKGFHQRFLADEQPDNSINCRRPRQELSELKKTLELMHHNNMLPRCSMANFWIPNEECVISTDGNMICMELAFTTIPDMKVVEMAHTRKGVVGMVLESENKSCFWRNLSKFSIVDQPLSHFEMDMRCDACFAIWLQSSHTGRLLYLLEFFLCPAQASYEHLRSFLNWLLPTMKHNLKSFKLACGKELGDELVVEVIEFSGESKLAPSEALQPDVFPIKFKSVQYTQKGDRHIGEKQTEEHIVSSSDLKRREGGKRKTEEHIVSSSDLKRREGKTGLHLNLETLKPHFGKKLDDVAEELNVGRSTIKRACRKCKIERWPNQAKYKKNPSLFEREMQPSTSNQQPLDKITESNDDVIAEEEEEAEKVIVQVKYEEDIIKFDSCVSLRLATLIEEVATRLNLEKGSFKLKYLDEDDDEILLTIDKDLKHCPKSRTATGKTCIQLLIRR